VHPQARSPEYPIVGESGRRGTTDIVWIDVSGAPSKSWQYVELFPAGHAGLLQRTDNSLGKVTTVKYAPAALSAAAARTGGTPWSTRINVGVPVVAVVDVDDSLGDPPVVTRYGYANGPWSPIERTFAGFGGGVETQVGDAFTPTLITTSTFDVGRHRPPDAWHRPHDADERRERRRFLADDRHVDDRVGRPRRRWPYCRLLVPPEALDGDVSWPPRHARKAR
jgi:hypothetical protein